jgi:hypothetical protein
MNGRNAFGFLFLGLGMLWLPSVAPGMVSPQGGHSPSTSELWLLIMGAVNASLGASALIWYALLNAARSISLWLAAVNEFEPTSELQTLHQTSVRAGDY